MDRQRTSKLTKVKNKAAAPVQISAEQLLREAKERQIEYEPPPPKQNITDPEELADFRLRKRKDFEDQIRRNRTHIGIWIRYAQWEATQNEFERARSVFERTIDVDSRNVAVWLKYAEMEMKARQVNHARNIFDRATTILPRVNQFWYKYTYMEEQLGNVAGCRQIFERWMKWHPDEQAWNSYINMELRYDEVDRARAIYERYVLDHIEPKYWIKYAKFETNQGEPSQARRVYERAVEFFGDAHVDETLYVNFAKFEETQREYERARAIYKYGLDKIPKEEAKGLFTAYTQFEKKYGSRSGIESVITSKRRFQYEEEVKSNPSNYDAWFDYIRLCESEGDVSATRDVYEKAIANVPPAPEKRLWRRYIYLWINYALFEELDVKDFDRCRDVYRACLDIIPHRTFTFAKIWLLFAHFEIRQKNVKAARTILGTAIGKCPKEKLFKGYIELELQLREFDRCRTLYNKYLEFNPANCQTWVKYSELEWLLGDLERARAIYELAIEQPVLDMPEVLWKSYIDFEAGCDEYDRARELYERLLKRTNHPKVWISFAQFEASIDAEDSVEQARHVYETADKEAKNNEDKSERLLLLESWLDFEREHGSAGDVEAVNAKMPRKVKRRREVFDEDGTSEGWEEYYDYIYPDEVTRAPILNVLEMAHRWKASQAYAGFGDKKDKPESGDGHGDEGEGGDDDGAEAEGEAAAAAMDTAEDGAEGEGAQQQPGETSA